MPNRPIYVIGHKNPDTDSVCSAIAYAALKQAQGFNDYVPARCGNSNARIDAILQRFQTPLPVFVGDVTPRVRDVMTQHAHTIAPEATCAEALELIDRYDIRALPVIAKGQNLRGVITIFNLGEFFVPKPKNLREMRRVHSSVNAIARSLKARTLHVTDPERNENIFLRVGAMELETFGRFTSEEGILPAQSGVIVGDRREIQLAAIDMGVRLLVVTGNLELAPDTVEKAKEKGVCLMVSPYDSATTAWIIRTATFVEPLMDTDIVRWQADEKLASLRRRIATLNDSTLQCVTDADGKLLGVFTRGDLLKPSNTQLVLVDHNELSQAVTGADEVTIIEIIDHHRLGSAATQQPILFHNEPVGSTCTIVADLYRQANLVPKQAIAGLMMSGLISDTMNLRSPTSTRKDAEILHWLSHVGDIDIDPLVRLIFDSGSLISRIPVDKLITSDCKLYQEGETRFSVAQVEELGFDRFREHADEIADALEAYCKKEKVLFSCLLVTDINTQNSLLLVVGDHTVCQSVSYPPVDAKGRIFDLPGVVSRKKQLVPYLSGLLHSLGMA